MNQETGIDFEKYAAPKVEQESMPLEDILAQMKDLLPAAYVRTASDRGEIAGIEHGIKPAAFVPELKRAGRRELSDGLLLIDGVLVDPAQVKARVAREPELAKLVNWDLKKTVEENVEGATANVLASPRDQARFGFILGYPETAVKGYMRRHELIQSGVQDFRSIAQQSNSWKGLTALRADEWSVRDQAILKEIGEKYQGIQNRYGRTPEDQKSTIYNNLMDRVRRQYVDELVEIYQNEFGLTAADADVMAREEIVHINTPNGEPVYSFKVFGRDADKAPDVVDLRNKVSAAFAEEEQAAAK